jgi:hypothetical protein
VLNQTIFQPFEGVVASSPRKAQGETFSIPGEMTHEEKDFAKFLLVVSDKTFARGSLPWTCANEAAWRLLGKTEYMVSEWRRLEDSGDIGPLFFLVMAHFDPQCVGEALARLDIDRLRRECRFLWEQDSPIACGTERFAKALRDLNEQEVRALLTLLPPQDAKYAAEGAEVLRENRDRPIQEAMPAAIDAMWRVGLEVRIRAALAGLKARDS